MATTQEMLTEARAALHDLSLGKQARVVVDQNGERIEFTATNTGKLRAYIAELEKALATANAPKGPLKAWM